MQFGRVDNVNGIDFSLPPDASLNKWLFDQPPQVTSAKIYIGCPVWTDRGYVGKIYPKGTKSKDYLKAYGKQFNSIEVNATHYNVPSLKVINDWKAAVPEDFRFCPKFPQLISHRRDIDLQREWTDRFLEAIYHLGDRLGPSFIQFPPHFKPQRMEELYRFLENLPEDFELAVEVRHADWFATDAVVSDWFDLFQHFGVIANITDTAGRRDVLHQVLSTKKTFIRFTGNNLHPTDYQRIDAWVSRLLQWVEQGLEEIYFFMHQPEKHLCADLATYMIQEIRKQSKADFGLRTPTILSEQSLFD